MLSSVTLFSKLRLGPSLFLVPLVSPVVILSSALLWLHLVLQSLSPYWFRVPLYKQQCKSSGWFLFPSIPWNCNICQGIVISWRPFPKSQVRNSCPSFLPLYCSMARDLREELIMAHTVFHLSRLMEWEALPNKT